MIGHDDDSGGQRGIRYGGDMAHGLPIAEDDEALSGKEFHEV